MDADFGKFAPAAVYIAARHAMGVYFEHISVVGHGRMHTDATLVRRMNLSRTGMPPSPPARAEINHDTSPCRKVLIPVLPLPQEFGVVNPAVHESDIIRMAESRSCLSGSCTDKDKCKKETKDRKCKPRKGAGNRPKNMVRLQHNRDQLLRLLKAE